MSIVTRTGDNGTTGLMFGKRVPKSDARVEAYGAVDELNAALGLARVSAQKGDQDALLKIQEQLIGLMGELATVPEDLERYQAGAYGRIVPEDVQKLEVQIMDLEKTPLQLRGWALPGANPAAAALDFARTVCRRAERRVCLLLEGRQIQNAQLVIYLNRLADLLWLLARRAERP
jgi:cob(I)alamin adenosyltransferase